MRVLLCFWGWAWGGGSINTVYIKCTERTEHLSGRRRSACVCLHPLAVVEQPCPTPYTRAAHEWAGPWVPGPPPNQRLVKQSLAGRVSQWRTPRSGRRPIECAQNVGTWIRAHVDARKLPRERASKDTNRRAAGRCLCVREAERRSWGWAPRCCSSDGVCIDGSVVS